MSIPKHSDIEIIDFKEQYASYFKEINLEWLEAYFYVEDYDYKILSEPLKHIIQPGGHIFFAKIEDQIVGTAALISREENSFELSKMGILESHRGLKIGNLLMQAAINYSIKQGKATLWLESNRKLKPALALYKKFGFEETPLNPATPYERCDIRMTLPLTEDKTAAMKKYMIVERFKKEHIKELYARFDAKGRMLPEGVNYLDSWINEDVETCYQLMESENLEKVKEWVSYWKDLADFEIIPVIDSKTAKEKILAL